MLVRARLNQKISGQPGVDWISHTLRRHLSGRLPLARCLSLGCGEGELERRLARENAFDEAMGLCTEILIGSMDAPGFEFLRTYGEGLAAGAELKQAIVEKAHVVKPTVFIDFGGGSAQAQLVAAAPEALRFDVKGNAMSLRWSLLAPRRFYGVAGIYQVDK